MPKKRRRSYGKAAPARRAKPPAANWLDVGMDAWLLGAEAGMVIAMRSARLAMGGALAASEAQRMVTEKLAANMALGVAMATGRLGSSSEQIAKGSIAHYQRRVRANRRRLARG